jgi:amidohydrolase
MVDLDQIRYLRDDIIAYRRRLHAYPEVGFQVRETHDFIEAELKRLGIAVTPHVGTNSLIGTIMNGEGPVVGLRADIDALNLEELNEDIDYRSNHPGVMHACGHDAHTAMLLGAASFLVNHKDMFCGTIKLIFQEAEEGPHPGGAKALVDSGLLKDVTRFYALHVSPEWPSGSFALKRGVMFASVSTFTIVFRGKGCHAAYPQLGINPIVMQSEAVMKLASLVPKTEDYLNSAVVSVTQVHGGTTHNIIPETVMIQGTIRTFSNRVKDHIKHEIESRIGAIAKAHRGIVDISIIDEYDSVFNHPDAVDDVIDVVTSSVAPNAISLMDQPTMGGEDFFRYLELAPGAIAWMGTRKDERTSYGLHHPRFNIDEDALMIGVNVLINLVLKQGRK